ncbi:MULTISPECIES: acyl carrier protein [Streptomyces]|uniref:Actinorhodin polyketide synthase acyl carrier protein n=1 Tax=Streptomyces hydrogenans TaxID=1873719 RepID=A0ABQ3PB25_9ACTN|nr:MULTISPECIES: acyl carrier protein [Streptomyces]MCM1949946.1 acyl carrier protein [Streptomyces sp. G2]GHG08509.1 actinorhodin polyketide synthase acyl carrier protein [Streptomyces hydrogenans]GHI22208.1 actinorhodin polyketide synthase acyl carrier protein [Streptomyces hydrogenans]
MSSLELNDLYTMMIEAAGVDDGVVLDADAAERGFEDLGYDSLAVLELFGRIERVTGISIPEEAAHDLLSPAAVIAYVNGSLTPAGA